MKSVTFGKALILLVAASSLTFCKKDKKSSATAGVTNLTLKVQNVGPTGGSLHATAPATTLLTGTGAGNSSFTPDSYKLWIETIVVQDDSGNSNQFYQCDSSAADCEVDFASKTSTDAFEAKLSSLPIAPGTWTKVWLNCTAPDPIGGYVKVKGQVTLADSSIIYTANTDDAGESLTTDSTKAGELTIKYTGGSCGLTMPLSKPLVIQAAVPTSTDNATQENVPVGTSVTMTMFSNLLDTIYYTPMGSPGMGGCRLSDANVAANTGGPGICVIYPSVFPYFGTTTPTVEYYKVANSKTSSTSLTVDDSNVIVKVIKDSDGTPFWASLGQFFTENTPNYGVGDKGVSGYTNSVNSFKVNDDKSLTIMSQEDGFAAFKLEAHEGEVKGEGIENGAGTGQAVTYYYKAFPYTP